MPKILAFSDIHIHNHKNSQDRLQNCLDVLYWVFNTAREHKIKDVIFAGDLFQDRSKISVFTYHQTYKIISQFPELNFWFLLGNHDLWYFDKTDISSVAPFGALPNVTVIDRPTTHNIAGLDIDFLPFTHNPIEVMSENFHKKSTVLIGHIAVHGAVLNFHHRTKSEVSVEIENDMIEVGKELFDGYKRVFLGHYHGAQQLTDTVEYIGSALQLTFGEAFQKKHIVVLDTETLEKQYIENDISPKHLILTPDQLKDYPLEGNFVQIIIEDAGSTNIMEMKLKLLEQNPAQIKFIEDKVVEKDDSDKVKKFNLTDGDVLQKYIASENCGNLDKELLLNIGKGICLEN